MSASLSITPLQSPRIARLQADMQHGADAALAAFWSECQSAGGPLLEPLPAEDLLAGTHLLVTFAWRAETPLQHCLVVSALGEIEKPETLWMENLPGTHLWYRSYRARRDVRLAYCFAPDIPLDTPPERLAELVPFTRPDPFNPNPLLHMPLGSENGHFTQSLLEGPDALSRRLYLPNPNAPAGRLEKIKFTSRTLGNERPLWVYLPAGYNPEAEPYPLLLLFDGQAYTSIVPAHTILDNLIAAGEIPPVIALLPDSLDGETRNRELPCHEPFLHFLERELLPWARKNYNLSLDPHDAVIAGSSYGGLAASWAALRRPHLFGNVLSQAGAYWWRPGANWQKNEAEEEEFGWLTRRYIEHEKQPIRFYQEIGLLEDDLIGVGANRHFRDVLRAKGYPVDYREFYSGHDYACWRETLADGLISLFGRHKVNESLKR